MTLRTPSNAVLLRPETLPRHERGGGVSTTPLVTPADAAGFITGYTSFGAGAVVPFHSHNCEESVVLMEGRAALDIDGMEYELKPQDVTYIPPGISHRFRNLSRTEPMKILWIYASVNATRTLTVTGVTRPVLAEHGGAQCAAPGHGAPEGTAMLSEPARTPEPRRCAVADHRDKSIEDV